MPEYKFIIECPKCGAKGFFNPEDLPSQIGIHFNQGTINIMDSMSIFCRKCGFHTTDGIEWPIKLNKE